MEIFIVCLVYVFELDSVSIEIHARVNTSRRENESLSRRKVSCARHEPRALVSVSSGTKQLRDENDPAEPETNGPKRMSAVISVLFVPRMVEGGTSCPRA